MGNEIEHHGVKGMKWGFVKKLGLPEVTKPRTEKRNRSIKD